MRGELKLMENVMAFFVIIILGMIALIYFSTAQSASERQIDEEREDLRAIQTARSLYNMPEISCTFTQTGRCVDLEKAQALRSLLDGDYAQVYFPILGRSRVAIGFIGAEDTILIYDALNSPNYRQIHVPVIVHDPLENTRSFGWIEVRV